MTKNIDTQQLQEKFNLAIELPEDERAGFLKKVSGDDLEMLEQLQSLVACHFGAAEDFLESSPVLEPLQTYLGREVGPYKLLAQIGKGGMADVYLASRSDGVFKNNVALKLVRLSTHNEEFITRLHRERLILSDLKHPNIANLLDGGNDEDGTPYYVMDYIEGEDLIEYVKHHNLSIREKLNLFLKICAGVSAAHRNLIIHRDLKPSNIMVTADGEPRLLDFGIAKDMTADAKTTSLLPMTPRYASPEQLRGDLLGTATDIYSLGVILYEVLTGYCPYESDTPLGLIREIETTTPKLMSQKMLDQDRRMSRLLSGDLDTIVMKSLHKEPDRRYASVFQFADDIERYLTNKPVVARADSLWYRGNRFVMRNWIMILVIGVALVTVLSVNSIQQARVMKERDIAESERDAVSKERDKLRRTKEFMIGLFKIADPGQVSGNSITARQLLDQGLKQIDQGLKEQPEFRSELMTTMGVVYRELGLYDTSLELLEEALALRRERFPNGSVELADSLDQLGTLSLLRGEQELALDLYNEALAIYRQKFGEEHRDVANVYLHLGDVFQKQGDFSQAKAYFEKSLAIGLKTLGDNHHSIGRNYVSLGIIQMREGKFDQAIEYYEIGLAIYSNTIGDDHPDAAYGYSGLAGSYLGKSNFDLAIKFMEKSLSIYLQTLGARHPNTAASYANLGIVHQEKGDQSLAAEFYNKALVIRLESLGSDHPAVGITYTNLGVVFLATHEYDQAIEVSEKALSIFIKNYGDDYVYLMHPYENLGEIYHAKGEDQLALSYFNKAHIIAVDKLGTDHPDTISITDNIANLEKSSAED